MYRYNRNNCRKCLSLIYKNKQTCLRCGLLSPYLLFASIKQKTNLEKNIRGSNPHRLYNTYVKKKSSTALLVAVTFSAWYIFIKQMRANRVYVIFEKSRVKSEGQKDGILSL